MFKMNAELCEGRFKIESELGVGTKIELFLSIVILIGFL